MLEEMVDSLNLIITQTQKNYGPIGIMISILWGIYILSRLFPQLIFLGIRPRKLSGLPGIVCAPFLHANFNHLFFNCIPLVVLSNFILIDGISYFIVTTISITLLSGVAIWLFARPLIHVGASGVISGYWGFLVYNIYQSGTLTAIILGLVSAYYFAGIFLGIFPGKKGVSWESHFIGLLAGLLTSYLWHQYPQLPFLL